MSQQGWPKPRWDGAAASKLVGAVVLVGITYVRPEGPEQTQMFGVVTAVDEGVGIELSLSGSREGETYVLPPDLTNIHPAHPGEYRLRSTGEVVIDPDFLSSWTIQAPES